MTNSGILKILDELNLENGSNYKMSVLKKYKDNELLKRVLALAYDKVLYTFGITMKNVRYTAEAIYSVEGGEATLEFALDFLENQICTRNVTGNEALHLTSVVLEQLCNDDVEVVKRILGRNLKINLGKTNIVKVFPGLISKQVYCRCDLYSDKTAKNINFKDHRGGAYIQKKSDGTFKETSVSETVDIVSRSGEQYEMKKFQEFFKDARQGAYIGEMTVVLDDALFNKIMPSLRKKNPDKAKEIEEKYSKGWKILDRSTGNGLINSDDIPEDNIVYELWDYIPFDEYKKAQSKDKKNPPKMDYYDRLEILKEEVLKIQKLGNSQIQVIEHYIVKSIPEALQRVQAWMEDGYEGGVLKDFSMKFKDGTSQQQLKLKLEIELDLRVLEFLPGNKGSKNEAYFSAIVIGNDEGTIRTQVGVTTMTEAERDWFHENRDSVIGEIMEVQCNDITIGSGKSQYALSHGRYIQMRTGEKTETDTLERAFETKKMAMMLGSSEV